MYNPPQSQSTQHHYSVLYPPFYPTHSHHPDITLMPCLNPTPIPTLTITTSASASSLSLPLNTLLHHQSTQTANSAPHFHHIHTFLVPHHKPIPPFQQPYPITTYPYPPLPLPTHILPILQLLIHDPTPATPAYSLPLPMIANSHHLTHLMPLYSTPLLHTITNTATYSFLTPQYLSTLSLHPTITTNSNPPPTPYSLLLPFPVYSPTLHLNI